MINSLVTSDCRRSGKLFFRNPIRHGCGEAFNNFSSLSQNSSGSTLVSINSCIKVRTLRSTDLGSRLDSSNRFAKNLRHFSLVLSVVWRWKEKIYSYLYYKKRKKIVFLFYKECQRGFRDRAMSINVDRWILHKFFDSSVISYTTNLVRRVKENISDNTK